MNWKEAPDSTWIPFIRELTELITVLVMALLASVIALGHVEDKSSFGLGILLGALATYLVQKKKE